MAFPQMQGQAFYSSNALLTSHNIPLPSGIVKDELLVIYFGIHEWDDTSSTPSGWTQLITSTYWNARVYIRKATGTEGSTVTITTSSAAVAAVSRRYSGWHGTLSTGCTATAVTQDSTFTMDPPNHSPGWGSVDIRWVAGIAGGEVAYAIDQYPASYTSNQHNRASTSGGGGVRLAIAERELTTSSQNPGIYSHNAGQMWGGAYTLSIRPGSFPSPILERSSAFVGEAFLNITSFERITTESAHFDGTGDMTADAVVLVPIIERSAQFDGTAEVEATAETFYQLEADFGGFVNVDAEGELVGFILVSAQFDGTAEVEATAEKFIPKTADFLGTAEVTANATRIIPRSAGMDGSGALAVSAIEKFRVAPVVDFLGTAEVTTFYIKFTIVSADFQGLGSLDATATLEGVISATADFAVSAVVTVSSVERFFPVSAAFLGTASLSAVPEDSLISVGAMFQASGNLSTGPPVFVRLWVEQSEQVDVWREVS